MRSVEQKAYSIGIGVIWVVTIMATLLFLNIRLNRMEEKYQNDLQNIVLEVAEHPELASQYEAFEVDAAFYSCEIEKTKAIRGTIVLVTLSLLFVLLCGSLGYHRLHRKIDEGEQLLLEAIEANYKNNWEQENWKIWQKRYEKRRNDGALGRLYHRIWEVSQIVFSRESERKKEALYQKNMLTDISHQLKTPLASLQVFFDIFEKKETDAKIKEMIEQCNLQLDRMKWLVMGILKIAQIESGCMEYHMKEVSVYTTIMQCVESLQYKLSEKDIEISWSGNREITFQCDVPWMQEAIVNVLKNAIDFAPEKSTIFIHAEQTSIATVFVIEDRGPGIAREHLPKIFNRFYRVPTPNRGDSVGIGLALAKTIVESQGGLLNAQSERKEPSYTRFVFTFLTKE